MDQEEFENWLREQDRETCAKIATRAALRVFPVVAQSPFYEGKENLTLLTARTLLISGASVTMPTPGLRSVASSAARTADAAAYAASVTLAPSGFSYDPAFEAVQSAVETAIRASDGDARDVLAGVFADTQIPPNQLFLIPLWHDKPAPNWDLPDENLLDTPAFAFWKEWYEGFLHGTPMDWDLQREVALIPDAEWEKGAEHIARLIEEIRARLALRKRIAELESALVVASGDRLGIGGNNPPEAIDAELPVAKELLVIWEPLQDLKEEVEAKEPDKGRVARAIEALGAALKAGLKWAAKKADLAVDSVIKWGGGGGRERLSGDEPGQDHAGDRSRQALVVVLAVIRISSPRNCTNRTFALWERGLGGEARREMRRFMLLAVLATGLAAGSAEAGPIKRACLKADRAAASRELCACIERVARPMFSASQKRRIAKFFADPHLSQELRASDRGSDERFWEQYKAWGAAAEAQCG